MDCTTCKHPGAMHDPADGCHVHACTCGAFGSAAGAGAAPGQEIERATAAFHGYAIERWREFGIEYRAQQEAQMARAAAALRAAGPAPEPREPEPVTREMARAYWLSWFPPSKDGDPPRDEPSEWWWKQCEKGLAAALSRGAPPSPEGER